MQKIIPQVASQVRNKMAREGVEGTKEELNAIFSRRFNEAVSSIAHISTGWFSSHRRRH